MVTYTCDTCHRNFSHKGNYERHLDKKIPCIDKNLVTPHNTAQTPKTPHNTAQILKNRKKSIRKLRNSAVFKPHNGSNDTQNLKLYKCSNCDKTYTRLWTLNRHIRNSSCAVLLTENSGIHHSSSSLQSTFVNICSYCGKKFARNDILNRHVTKYCKVQKDIEKQKEELYERVLARMGKLEEQTREYKAKIGTINR